MYDILSIPCPWSYLLFANAYEVFTVINKYSTLGSHICSFTSQTTYGFLVWYNLFSLFMIISFNIVNTCLSIQNINVHEVVSDSLKYFTFVNHICSFTFNELYLLSVNVYELFTAILKLFIFGSHICEFNVSTLWLCSITCYQHVPATNVPLKWYIC